MPRADQGGPGRDRRPASARDPRQAAGRDPLHTPARDPRRALGLRGEQLACAHLERLGYAVLARNVRTRFGEIDVVACDAATLAFVEVKTRRVHGPGVRAHEHPLAGLRGRQRARLRRLAAAWLAEGNGPRPPVRALRFDAIGVAVDAHDRLLRLDHVEGAW